MLSTEVASCLSVLQSVAECCRVLQCVAVCVLPGSKKKVKGQVFLSVLQ